MGTQSNARPFHVVRQTFATCLALIACLLGMGSALAAPLTVTLVGVARDGTQTVLGGTDLNYRWTVEVDATKASIPGKPADKTNYSFSFHTSYMPVVAAGRVGTVKSGVMQDPDVVRLYGQALPEVCPASGNVCIDPAKRYFVSVAADGYQMGAAPVVFSNGGAQATVYLNQYDLPTAQVSVFAFEDNNPINGAPDLPEETGLEGFTVLLAEAGGTYGQSGGAVTQDAFGNPLGTTYNEDGSVDVRGKGIILTGPDGTATIKNLFPAKYTVFIAPPPGSDWHQTSTIEGGLGSDAWVKNNEPSFFQEFGPPGHHVFIGFSRSGFIAKNDDSTPVLNGSRQITGRIVNTHHSRPPVYTFYAGAPVTECWVGLNEANGGRALYATPCRKDSTFTIPNVPDGTYEVVVWDTPLDIIISATTVTVAGGNLALGDLPVSSWFGRYQGRVFQDIDGTGLPFFANAWDGPYIEVDPKTGLEREVTRSFAAGALKPSFGEGIASNIRFRDGSIYQSTTTKQDGTFAFTEVFPFFNWMVAEIDYARFKASGATIVVDEGGAINPADNLSKLWGVNPTTPYSGLFGSNDPDLMYDPWTRLSPQLQADSLYYRNENCGGSDAPGQCAILLEGMQTFLGASNHIEWGKQPYGFNENGGIAGIVHYAITRAEDDPRFAAAENWEPGIPRVQVNLFLDCDGDGKPDQPANDGSGNCTALSSVGGYQYDQPDVDNYPFCWRDPDSIADLALCPRGKEQGPEDIKRSASGGSDFSYGDVFRWGAPGAAEQLHIGLGKTDSWDDSVPTGCPTTPPYTVPSTGETLDCFDGLRNYNQIVPSVFDGGYAFGRVAGQAELPMFIGTEGKGTYIVEAVAPPGYLHQGNGDKNVVFGDSLKATPAALPFACVGMELPVPERLTLFADSPDADNPNYLAGQRVWNKCDMKAVPLLPGTNPAPDFYMFTEAPVAGHGVGFILDDTATEFNQYAPTFGEKYSPPHLPVSVQDWTGREIARVYSDQFGSYNFLVPSTFTINPPYPSGVMPSMMVACMNHPGPVKVGTNPDGSDQMGIDPYFNRNYTQFCYTLQYLPGKTTYLDTPVLPISAFASVDKNPLDCECADGTPAIYSATNGDNGPWVPTGGGTLTLISEGQRDVVNPAYDPTVLWPAPPVLSPGYTVATGADDLRLQKTIKRNFGFGPSGTLTLGSTPLTTTSWSDGLITATIPANTTNGQQLIVRRGDNGKESVVGLTVHVGGSAPKKVNLAGSNGAYKTIQAAIDAAVPGDLISVAPGSYPEFVVMDKRVRLQGWGAGSVTINASKPSAGGLAAWRALIAKKVDPRCSNAALTVPTASGACPADTAIDPDTGRPTLVPGPNRTFDPLPGQTLGFNAPNNEPILFGAEEAPGVLILGRSNSDGTNCASTSGVLRVDGLSVTGSDAGGGILANGYACNLNVTNNRVVANYGTYGGGIRIGHTTLENVVVTANGEVVNYTDAVNRSPVIHHNWIAQNGATEAGGGGGITLGTGSNGYRVTDNYVCGNFSMADGGGMAHMGLSGGTNTIARNKFVFNQTFNQSADPTGGGLFIGGLVPLGGGNLTGTGSVVVDSNQLQGNQSGAGAGGGVSIARTLNGDAITLTNNMIVNNVAAYAGGGVATATDGNAVRVVNNTVASNVSTATNRQSFGAQGASAPSTPQVAGIAVLGGTAPLLLNNILWANRSYIYLIDGLQSGLFNPGTTAIGSPNPSAQYRDFGRVGSGAALVPRYSVLTTGGIGNAADPNLASCSNTAPTSGTGALCNRLEPVDSSTLFVKPNDFSSVIDPNQPLVLADATVALLSALTFDETGNFINVIFSPLTLWETAVPAIGQLRADYHITADSSAKDHGRNRSTSTSGNNSAIGTAYVPTTDFDAEARGTTVDIGADESVAQVIADLSITNTNNRTTVTPGGTLTYTIVVRNNSSTGSVTGATVSDARPSSISSWSWSCAPAGVDGCGTSGNSGTGNINNKVLGRLVAGASVTFTIASTVSNNATVGGGLTNTATVAVPNGASDPDPSNNSATDTDTIIARYTLLPNPVNFGQQLVGTTSAVSSLTFVNNTDVAITLRNQGSGGAVALSGSNSNNFAVAAGTTCLNGGAIAANGGSCVVNVTFTPSSTGNRTATVGVYQSGNSALVSSALSGQGVSPNLSLACQASQTTCAFGNVNGTVTQTLTLTNTAGTSTVPFVMTGSSVAKTNGGNGTYSIVGGTCQAGATLAAGGGCTVIVQFTSPSGNSTTNGTVTVTGTGEGGQGSFTVQRNVSGA